LLANEYPSCKERRVEALITEASFQKNVYSMSISDANIFIKPHQFILTLTWKGSECYSCCVFDENTNTVGNSSKIPSANNYI